MPRLPDAAVGSIVAALIAGLVSLLGLIISKEQKVSEFRQAWIDALRAEIADLIAHLNAVYGTAAAQFPSVAEAWKVVKEDYLAFNNAAARIRLRLNPSEPTSVLVLKTLEEIEALFNSSQAADYKRLDELQRNFVSESQVILKQEWRRVRSGERVYRVARTVAIIVSLSCAFVLVAYTAWQICR